MGRIGDAGQGRGTRRKSGRDQGEFPQWVIAGKEIGQGEFACVGDLIGIGQRFAHQDRRRARRLAYNHPHAWQDQSHRRRGRSCDRGPQDRCRRCADDIDQRAGEIKQKDGRGEAGGSPFARGQRRLGQGELAQATIRRCQICHRERPRVGDPHRIAHALAYLCGVTLGVLLTANCPWGAVSRTASDSRPTPGIVQKEQTDLRGRGVGPGD